MPGLVDALGAEGAWAPRENGLQPGQRETRLSFAGNENQGGDFPITQSSAMASHRKEDGKPQTWLAKEFTYLRRIGRGYFGVVLCCRNNTDGLEYAIK